MPKKRKNTKITREQIDREIAQSRIASNRSGGFSLVGKRIVAIKYMSLEEAQAIGWDSRPATIVLEGNSRLYVSSDEEGNEPGTLVAEDKGTSHSFYPKTRWEADENLEPKNLDRLLVSRNSLKGCWIASGHYMSGGKMGSMGWSKQAFVIKLDNGVELIPFSDEEGNEAGSWFGTDEVGDFAICARMTK